MIKGVFIINRKYIISTITLVVLICFTMISFYLFSIGQISDIYSGETYETIYNLKEDFLKDTINNVILNIDLDRKAKAEYMEKLVSHITEIVEAQSTLSDEAFNNFFVHFFKDNSDYSSWTVMLWDKAEDKALYDSQSRAGDSWESTLARIKAESATYGMVYHGDDIAVFGISKVNVDEQVKGELANKIRNLRFDDGSYVWINEIIHYQGGKNYAIRRVHPNLPETEGMYLSTDMTDEKGNFPYLTELEGINKSGELFFTYYFKELNSEQVSKKLTYAKLYKDFNWVIAMGVYMNDLQLYTEQSNQKSKALVSRLTWILVVLFVVMMLLSYSIIMLMERVFQKRARKQLESEANQDLLTEADSRRKGVAELTRAFRAYRKTGSELGIMMLDVDFFKSINDTWGHDVGDQILVEIVKTINSVIRSSDRIIRWGGDEFIVIFYGLQQKNALAFGEKILAITSSIKLVVKEQEISPTLSIGFSFFKEGDSDYTEVLKRADEALYQSKTNGRNQVSIII